MLELYADKSPWQAYFRVLKWTVGSLDEDNKFVKFLDGFRGLFKMQVDLPEQGIKQDLEHLVEPVIKKLFMTCRPGFLPEDI